MNEYILPEQSIAVNAQQITGFTVNNGKLFQFGKEVDSVSLCEALEHFLNWLEKYSHVISCCPQWPKI